MVTGDPLLADERTDVFLLGATLHEVITGVPPYLGANVREALERAFDCAAPSFPPSVPIELAELCRTAMAADPRTRFQTVIEFRDALHLFLNYRGAFVLVDTGNARLAAVEQLFDSNGSDDPQRWFSLLSEVRFVFAQAIDRFPLNTDAQTGLKRTLELALRRELRLENVGSARTLMAELERMKPAPELIAQLRQLESKEAQRAAHAARLKQLIHERNPAVSAPQRTRLLVGLVGAIASPSLAVWVANRLGWYEAAGRWGPLAPPSVMLFIYVVAVAVGRRSLLATRLNREVTFFAGVNFIALVVGRVIGIALDVPLPASLSFSGVMLAALTAAVGFIWYRGLLLSAGLFLLGAIGCAASPGHAPEIYAFSNLFGLLSELAVLRHWMTQEAAPD